MKLTEKKIRDIAGRSGSRSGGSIGGGGGVSASWVDENYIGKDFFNEIFEIQGKKTTTIGSGTPVEVDYVFEPNELPETKTTTEGGVTTTVKTEITKIKIKAGAYTDSFLSALGLGTGGGSGGGGTLAGLSDVTLTNPQAGQILVYRNTHWVNEDMPSPGGSGTVTSVALSVPTGLLVSGGNSQTITNNGTFAITFASGYSLLAASDKTAWDTLKTYFDANGNALKANALNVLAAKTAWGKTYINANGEPLSISGDMSNVGDIQMSDPTVMSNGRYIYFDEAQDFFIRKISDRFIIKVDGTETINIYNNKFYVATMIETSVGVLSSGYVTALSDIRFKEVVDRFELDIEKIAAASLIHFTWKDRENDHSVHAGGIAQEWQKILPEAVVETEDGKLAMDYGVIGVASAISIARKVKEQQREIDDLKRKNAEIEARMERLEKLIMEGRR